MSATQDYQLFTDATADIPAEVADEIGLHVIPMDFILAGCTYSHYPDGRELSCSGFYGALRGGAHSTTVQINIARYEDCFEPVLKAGQDILYICFSSALSGTYQTSLIAANELRGKYPERRLEIIDSRCASIGEGVLSYAAALRKNQGYSMTELANWILENRDYATHQFVVDDLEHLRRGGRISPLATVIGSALSIKPFLRVDREGALFVHARIRGRKGAVEALVREIPKNYDPGRDPVIFIGHGDCPEDAQLLLDMIMREHNPPGRIIIAEMGPIIGSHVGAGTLALAFMGRAK